jgi:sugar phosphate isomerase/epimerase
MGKARIAFLHGPHDLRIEEVRVPDPKPDQVLIKLKAAGICGSDLGHVHIKDCKVDIARATVRFCLLGEGHMAPYLDDIAAALKRDKYQGVVSLESVYRPDNGTFEDGFRTSLPTFKRLFGA